MASKSPPKWSDVVSGTSTPNEDYETIYSCKLSIYLNAKEELLEQLNTFLNKSVIPDIECYKFENWENVVQEDVSFLPVEKKFFLAYKKSGNIKKIEQIIKRLDSVEEINSKLTDYISKGSCFFCKNVFHNVYNCPILMEKQCMNCGKKGHLPSHCNGNLNIDKCENCGKWGHMLPQCRLIEGKPDSLVKEIERKPCKKCGKNNHTASECWCRRISQCELCGKYGHTVRECTNKPCSKCGRRGHTTDNCKNKVKIVTPTYYKIKILPRDNTK